MTTAVDIVFERRRKPPDTNCQGQLNLKEVAEQYASGESSLDPKHLQLNGVARSSSTRSELTYFSFKPGCSVHTSPSFSQQGLGFEPLLGVRGRHFSARYGPRPLTEVPFSKCSNHISWPARALELNRYLLDGINPDGTPCQYRQSSNRFPNKSAANQSRISKREFVRMIAEEAVSVRVDQLFVDGNHRTAILSIYEKLADAGWWLDMSAVDLYILISNRSQLEWNAIKLCMVKVILRHLEQCPDIPFEARHIFARRVKLIAEINTLFEDVEAFLASQEIDMSVKRQKWRSFRRRSKKRHAQFMSLYGRPHVK